MSGFKIRQRDWLKWVEIYYLFSFSSVLINWLKFVLSSFSFVVPDNRETYLGKAKIAWRYNYTVFHFYFLIVILISKIHLILQLDNCFSKIAINTG